MTNYERTIGRFYSQKVAMYGETVLGYKPDKVYHNGPQASGSARPCLMTVTSYWGGPFLRACFFLRFEDQKRAPSLSYCFASISIGLRPSRPASKPASKLALRCFVLISMVSRHWSSRLALRPAFNFVSSYKLLVSLQFPST